MDREKGLNGDISTNKIIVTMHRRENLPNIREWFNHIELLANENQDFEFVLYAHPNPQVQANLDVFELVRIEKPLDYDDFIVELSKCLLTITDSGGIQEEMSWFRKKCFVCRTTTERPESIGSTTIMTKTPKELYLELSGQFQSGEYSDKIKSDSPFGDGYSAKKIAKILRRL